MRMRKRKENGQRSIMAGLTNGRERPQLSSKFNLVAEVDSPFLRFHRSGRFDSIRTPLLRNLVDHQTTYSPFRCGTVAHSPSDNGLAIDFILSAVRRTVIPPNTERVFLWSFFK